MSITFRSVKGSKLTSDEVDGNFSYLASQVSGVGSSFSVVNGFSLSGQDLTILSGWVWSILGTTKTNASNVVINIPYAATGLQRIDLIVANASDTFVRIAGGESATNPVAPPVPVNTLQATFVSVTDSSVGSPMNPVVGAQFVKKTEYTENPVTDSGDISISLDTESTAYRLTGAVDSVIGFETSAAFDTTNSYIGKKVRLVNNTGADFSIQHNGSASVPARFPKEVDFLVRDKETIVFNIVKTDILYLEFESNSRDQINYSEIEGTPTITEHFKGKYTSEANLISAHPTASDGDYAIVDAGSGTDAVGYIWDSEEGWVPGSEPVTVSMAINPKTITSAQLNTQNVTGMLAYLNALSPNLVIAVNEKVDYLVSDTGQVFSIDVNGRTIGLGQTALTTAHVTEREKPYLKFEESFPAHYYSISNGNLGYVNQLSAIITDGTTGYTGVGSNYANKRRLANKVTSASPAGSTSQIRTGVPAGNIGYSNPSIEIFNAIENASILSTVRTFSGIRTTSGNSSGIGNIEPSTQINVVGLGNDSTDANMQIMHNDGTGTCIKLDLGSDFPAKYTIGQHAYRGLMYNPIGTAIWIFMVEDMVTGKRISKTITTNTPSQNQQIYPITWANNELTATAVEMTAYGWQVKNN